MADNMDKRSQKAIDDTSIYIQDTLLSVSAKIGESLKDAVNEAFDGVDASVIKTVSNDLTRSFKSAAKFSDNMAANQTKIYQGVLGTRDIEKQLEQLTTKREALERKIQYAKSIGAEISKEDHMAALKALREQRKELLENQKLTQKVEKNMGSTGEIFKRLGKSKTLGGLVDAEGAMKAMRKHSAATFKATGKGASKMSLFKKGVGASMKGLLKGPIYITAIIKVLKFVVDLFVGANKQAVELARSMGTSVDSADALRDRFRDVRSFTGQTRNNIENLVQAQKQLNDTFGATFIASNNILDSQTFLTKRLMISDTAAAKLNIRFAAFGKNATKGTDKIIEISQQFANTNGYAMQLDKLMNNVSEVSGQTAASFGFSNDAIAKGVLQVRKFGLNLDQARSIANSLLDFESSIGNELEAELLTGKEFNFERARMMAMTGDIAGATEDVMKQMQNLTEEQRKSPIIMESLAKASGLNVDQLQDAFLITQNNVKAAQQYERVLKSGNEAEIKKWKQQNMLEQATRKEIEARVTLGEQFAEAMQDVKQQFMGLVNGGTIQILIDAIQDFANFVDFFTGTSKKQAKSAAESIAKDKNVSKEVKQRSGALTKASEGPGFWDYVGAMSPLGAANLASKQALAQVASREQIKLGQKVKTGTADEYIKGEAKLDDFTIRSNPKDTLVMAGGTRFGEETNTLLKELIAAVREGGDVFIDGNKAGMALNLGAYRSSTA